VAQVVDRLSRKHEAGVQTPVLQKRKKKKKKKIEK
jgi:hypothetical protein